MSLITQSVANMTAPSDILVELSAENLPKLAALYKKRAPWAPYMVSFVHMTMQWQKSVKYKGCVKIMSPNNRWEEDGTIIATITVPLCHNHDIVVFTLDDHCGDLYTGLVETRLIDYTKRLNFFSVHEKHSRIVKKYINEKKLRLDATNPNVYVAISPKEASSFTIECPPDVYIGKLEPSAAKQIDGVWPHKFRNSAKYTAAFLEMNGGYGVFLKSNNELVAWCVKYTLGHLGIFQTDDKYKRKGYGGLVAKVLAKEIGEEGLWPVATILEANEASVRLFEKLGFRCLGKCTYFIING